VRSPEVTFAMRLKLSDDDLGGKTGVDVGAADANVDRSATALEILTKTILECVEGILVDDGSGRLGW